MPWRGFCWPGRAYIVICIVRSKPLRRAVLTAAAAATCVSVAGLAAPAALAATTPGAVGARYLPSLSASAPDSGQLSGSPGPAGAPVRPLFVPDLIAAVPGGITPAQLAKITKLPGVRAVLPVDGGKVTLDGQTADVLGVPPQAFRHWTPPKTAASAAVWADLAKGELVSAPALARTLHMAAGNSYPVSAAVLAQVPFGGQAALSIRGVDAMVDLARSAQLGLAKNFAVLINAPGVPLGTLKAQVKSVVGVGGQVVSLVSYRVPAPSKLPVDNYVPPGSPTSFLDLYKKSAATFCPGLSWTVLAAINEIESGDGANDGPSSAGALGPMQFLPSTWAVWGFDGFGPPGPPDIENPLDAVPSAARLLCADGGGNSATLPQAIFDYNHATWYVNEVLELAAEYDQEYP
jgi:hypothetical protein